MILINSQFLKVVCDDIVQRLEQKVNIFSKLNPTAKLIHLNSGDVVHPLAPCIVEAMQKGVSDLCESETFRGRGPLAGYPFLIDTIAKGEYRSHKIKIANDEIFINSGTKDGLCGIGDILCRDIRIAVVDPVYQSYIESNVIANRAGDLMDSGKWSHLIYLRSKPEDNFSPELPAERPDVIYLCYPSDPTGCVIKREELEKWVKYAIDNESLILFDATYAPFITDPDAVRSIYQIKGAKRVAVEFRSFSKSGGFSGLQCGFTVIPKEISGYSFSQDRSETLNRLWLRRKEIKSYPPSYIIQRGAAALYTPEGQQYIKENIDYYMRNASLLLEGLASTRLKYYGGVNSPYIWVESPDGNSWSLFEQLLRECHIVCSPGERFGAGGKGYIRLSAFAEQSAVIQATTRISDMDI